jgi:hypothetical protein
MVTQLGDEIAPKLPLLGEFTVVKVRLVLSMSLAVNVIVTETSSSVLAAVSLATGRSFTALIAIETLATFESKLPSLTLKVKLSVPA